MKLLQLRKLLVSFLLATLIASCEQAQKKDLLLGKWTFDKFEFTGKLVNIPPTEVQKANDVNNGLTIVFSSDNKFSSEQKRGIENNNHNGTYILLSDDKLVIMTDTSKIIQLDKTYLKLFRDSLSPVVVFRRQ